MPCVHRANAITGPANAVAAAVVATDAVAGCLKAHGLVYRQCIYVNYTDRERERAQQCTHNVIVHNVARRLRCPTLLSGLFMVIFGQHANYVHSMYYRMTSIGNSRAERESKIRGVLLLFGCGWACLDLSRQDGSIPEVPPARGCDSIKSHGHTNTSIEYYYDVL